MTEKARSSKCGDPDVFLCISDIVRGIYTDSVPVTLQATRRIRRLLSQKVLIFSVSSIVEAGVVPRLVEFLTYDHNPELQFESAWALTNIAVGTLAETLSVVTAGAIPVLIKCLSSSEDHIEVKAQAIWALGNIAGSGPRLRDAVIDQGIVKPLIQVINSSSLPAKYLSTAVWGLASMCRNKTPPPPFNEVKAFIPTLAKLIHHTDNQVLNESCWAISYLLDGGDNQIEEVIKVPSIVPRLVQLLKREAALKPALRAIGNIITGTDPQTQVVINCDALPSLGELLDHPDVQVQKDTAWALSNVLAGSTDQIQAVFDNNLIDTIIRKVDQSQQMVQKELVWSLTNLLSSGTVKQITSVLHLGLIPGLLKFLSIEQAQKVYTAILKKNNPKAAGVIFCDKKSLWKKIEAETCELLKREEELNAIGPSCKFLLGDSCSTNRSRVIQAGLVVRKVQMLAYHRKNPLKFEATRAITNTAGGNSAETKEVVKAVAFPALVNCLLGSQIGRMTEQAAWTLVHRGGNGPVYQQQVVLNRTIKAFIGLLKKHNSCDSSMIMSACTTFNVCHSDSNQLPPTIDEIKQFIRVLVQLACCPDRKVLTESSWSSHQRKTTDIVEQKVQAGIVLCTAQLLNRIDQEVINIAMNVLLNFTSGSDEQGELYVQQQHIQVVEGPGVGVLQQVASPEDYEEISRRRNSHEIEDNSEHLSKRLKHL